MANQNSSVWTQDPTLLERALDLRVNHGLDWEPIRKVLGLETKDQVRIKVNRVLAAIRKGETDDIVPTMGRYEYDFSVLDEDERPRTDEAEESTEASDEALAYEVEVPYARREYTFTGEEYIFVVNGEQVAWPKETWEAVVAYYSAEGANLTQQQIAQKFGANKQVVEACLRQYGHFKARPPVTREALRDAVVTGDTTPLMERAIEVAEHKFSAKLRDARMKHLERENLELRQELHQRGEVLTELRSLVKELAAELPKAGPVEKVTSERPGAPYVLHAPIFDPYIGLHTFFTRGWTTEYDTDIAVEFIRQHAIEMVRRIQQRPGTCEMVVLSLGGDLLHAIQGKTVAGRNMPTDRPDRFLVRAAVKAFKTWIDTVRPYTKQVLVLGIGGNHDGPLGELVVDFLAQHYADTEANDVLVDDTPSKHAWFIVGDTLHVIDHGEAFGNVTTSGSLAVAERIARRVAGPDYYKVRRIVFYVGHLHHREGARTPALDSTDKTQGHMEIIRVPVFCSASDYEEMLGFWNEQMADVFFLNERGRIADIARIYAEDMDLPATARHPSREFVTTGCTNGRMASCV